MQYVPLARAAGSSPTWLRMSPNRYELRYQELLFARASLDGTESYADTAEGRWTSDASGSWSVILTDPPVAADRYQATLQHDTWFGQHSIRFASGRVFRWSREGPYNSLLWTWLAGLLLWRTTWVLKDGNGMPVIRFTNYRVQVEQNDLYPTELPLLVLLGSFIMIGLLENSKMGD